MGDLSEEHWNDLFKSIGFITFQWSFIEHLMDNCILIIYHIYDGKNLPDKIPRTQLSRKNSLLKKYLNTLPKLAKYKNEMLPLIDKINISKSNRHWLIHGTVAKFTPDYLHLVKYNYGDEYHRIEYSGYNITDLLKYGNDIMGLATELGLFVQRFVKEAALHQQATKP